MVNEEERNPRWHWGFAELMRTSAGDIQIAAARIGVTPETLQTWLKAKHPEEQEPESSH